MEDLKNLRAFTQVAQYGSFTAAAEHLGISTAALSQNISRLEKNLATRLFNRTTRSLNLTDEGQALLDKLVASFENIEEALNEVRSIREEPAGLVRISTVTSFGKYCVLPLLPELVERYPKINFAISFHDGARGMSRQNFDIRINWGESREQDKVSQRLSTMPLVTVASPEYLARRGVPHTPDDLMQHDCINVTLPGRALSQWKFVNRKGRRKTYQVTPKGRLIIMDELEAVTNAALAGLGITVVAIQNVAGYLRSGRLQQVLADYDLTDQPEDNTEIIIQYSQRKHLPAKVKVVVDFLLDRLAQYPAVRQGTPSGTSGPDRG